MRVLSRLFRKAIVYHQIHQLTGIHYWQHLIFIGILCVGLIGALPAYISGQIIAVQFGRWGVFAINTVVYLSALFLFFSKKINYRVRFAIGIHITFFLGAALCFLRGPLSAGPFWLFAFPVMSGIFLGRYFAIYALTLNFLTLSIIYFGIRSGFTGTWETAEIASELWIVYALNHLCISIAITISFIILMEGLVKNIDCVQAIARSLEQSNQELKIQMTAYRQASWERQIVTTALDNSPTATLIFREDGTLRYANQSAITTLELPQEIQNLSLFSLGESWSTECQAAFRQAKLWGSAECELSLKPHNGKTLAFEVRLHRFDDNGEKLLCAFAINVTNRKEAERQLRHMAYHDHLTGLPNRAMYLEELSCALAKLRRDATFKFALLFVDLDKFKTVNDSLGHLAGDKLLKQVGQKLESSINTGSIVSRIGGDEFAFLVQDYCHVDEVWTLVQNILERLHEPVFFENHPVKFTASIGVVLEIDSQVTPEFLLRDADIAMYQAKFSGGNNAVVLDASIRNRFTQRFELENDLYRAIECNEFVMHYQPIVCIATKHLIGFEALLRWNHPRKGLILPAQFIPLAEESGLIITLGQQAIEQACAQLSRWRHLHPQFRCLVMSVNLSAIQFDRSKLLAKIDAILARYNLPPQTLKLEITESAIATDSQAAKNTIQQLKFRGVQVAVDDFGTGYSSLAYLQEFPIDTLKIDKSFILPLLHQSQNQALVQAILSLASALRFTAIAEGVETRAHAHLLQQMGCHYAQGWFYGKPMAGDRLEKMMLNSLQGDRTACNWILPTSDHHLSVREA